MAYPTVAEIRERHPMLAAQERFSDALLDELLAEIIATAETYCGRAFAATEATATLQADQWPVLILDPATTEVTEVTVDGAAWTEEQIAELTIEAGMVTGPSSWSGEIVVTYTHGEDETPPAIKRACREFVRAKALDSVSEVPRNAISYQDPNDGFAYRDSTADWAAGRPTGIRAVDDALNSVIPSRDVVIG